MPNFISEESGAVTVDWTVLTAGLVGLGLAVAGVASTGVQSTSNDIDETLRGVSIISAFSGVISNIDFTGGDRGGWTAGEVVDIAGFGEILVIPRGGETAYLPIDVRDSDAYAVVEFDMIFGDSWDSETGTISIAGEEVVVGTHSWREGEPDVKVIEGANDTTVTLTRSSRGSGTFRTGGSSEDYTYRVQVVAANDGRDLALGASTTLNSGYQDEFFGIDNVTVSGSNSR
ncbi:hypothetical protein ACK8OR_01485 [Jannaschia sp. KMU-145]|uniref:hypothetical protein n=1 Tax=Jannaschia halovivens TaxID=3388667 RepID=UPI00396AF8F1